MTKEIPKIYGIAIPVEAPGPGVIKSGFRFLRLLKVGGSGNDVVALQDILESKGFLRMPAGVSKGTFGAKTRVAIQEFQKSYNIAKRRGCGVWNSWG